jgi:hypothetical protein
MATFGLLLRQTRHEALRASAIERRVEHVKVEDAHRVLLRLLVGFGQSRHGLIIM